MQIKNSSENYGLTTIFLHWLMAILIIAMLCLGLYMTGLISGPQKLKLYGLHKALGVSILMLVTLRLMWRLSNIIPRLPTAMPIWEKKATHITHFFLYLCMFALPMTGWLMSSAAGRPVSFFGLFTLPTLMLPDKQILHLLKNAHEYLAYVLIAIVCLHVLAALKHHFIDKDNILNRMLRSLHTARI